MSTHGVSDEWKTSLTAVKVLVVSTEGKRDRLGSWNYQGIYKYLGNEKQNNYHWQR